jgi:hypothetical protein
VDDREHKIIKELKRLYNSISMHNNKERIKKEIK